jgi:2-phospho-L-lactate guanylyltransferase
VPDWTVVIPVKGNVSAKSRLGASPELALAIALDSVAAALDAVGVIEVIVVTASGIAPALEALGARVLRDENAGLNAAVMQGIAAAQTDAVAALLGDVPALQHEELAAALNLAEHHPLAFVPDADNDGTVLITALRSTSHRPAFGEHSRAAHLAAGYVELAIPAASGLRRDVDTAAQLAALAPRAGPRTSELLNDAQTLTRDPDSRP